MYKYLMLLLCETCFHVRSKRILVLHPVYAGSHILALRPVLQELANRGHQVRVVRWAEANDIVGLNSSMISETILAVNNTSGTIPYLTKEVKAKFEFPVHQLWKRGLNPLTAFEGAFAVVSEACKTLFENSVLLQELKRSKFDVAVVDLIYNECSLALAAHYLDLHVIGFWGLSFMSGESYYTSAFNPPSVIPHTYFPYSNKMTFFKRVLNSLYGLGNHLIMQTQFSYTNYQIQKYLEGCPHPWELLLNLSGVLINSNFALDYAKQLPPSFLHIGGIHIQEPKPLHQELEDFMNGSADGVILFSLGLSFDSEAMPKQVYENYFRVFSRLRQRVIVKSRRNPSFIPANVRVYSFIPQNDILSHPKTVLFITHCGIHGAMEAIYHGVKMIGIPLFFDQINIAARIQDLGIGVTINKMSSEHDIFLTVSEVLTNSRYDENVRNMSLVLRDPLYDPLKASVWLIEHVIQFQGAEYLKMQSRHLTFAQYFVLDVTVFLLGIISILVIIGYKFLQFLILAVRPMFTSFTNKKVV